MIRVSMGYDHVGDDGLRSVLALNVLERGLAGFNITTVNNRQAKGLRCSRAEMTIASPP
jgi:hypothetical protein